MATVVDVRNQQGLADDRRGAALEQSIRRLPQTEVRPPAPLKDPHSVPLIKRPWHTLLLFVALVINRRRVVWFWTKKAVFLPMTVLAGWGCYYAIKADSIFWTIVLVLITLNMLSKFLARRKKHVPAN